MATERCDESVGVVIVWQRLATSVVHSSPWFEVHRDAVVRPDGGHDTYVHVVAPGSVTVLALDDEDRVVLTRQWIYTHGGTQWRLPGGGVDPKDASPVDAARRELAEETGLRAREWEPIGTIHGADSLSNHVDHIFLATGLSEGESALEAGEQDLRVHRVPFERALELVRRGQLPHAGSAHALLATALRRLTVSD
ncbi:NUDIX hydrolase [Saccharothrix violaceirubra]|uniref:8-oxo-dGTP pyrophosphatase MutT (NUDIX family) n=1 Tax=Saccharothrix violaceirubra TaxID=413306 RepID=A0A7W7T3Q6_9PSEU|nr:NUDIX hydrolase [Saccharothrix violaceirubra]MBB4966025.1 8-oxo-dGTP pyrophosphatase MutT (NUDIX family) [Saccharothrix violaceirubra]